MLQDFLGGGIFLLIEFLRKVRIVRRIQNFVIDAYIYIL